MKRWLIPAALAALVQAPPLDASSGRRFSLLMGQDARALAFSGAGSAMELGAHGMFKNWAALSLLDRAEAGITHQTWLADTSFDSLALARPWGEEGGVGLGLAAFRVAPFDNTGGLAPAMDLSTYLFSMGGSRLAASPWKGKLYAGVGLSYLAAYFADAFSTRDLALHAGLAYAAPWKPLRLGFSLRNAGLLSSVGDPLPLEASFGGALAWGPHQLAMEVSHSQEQGPNLHLGWEGRIYAGLAGRLGASTRSFPGAPFALSLGLGLNVTQDYRLDYTALPMGEFGFQQAISLAGSFGPSRRPPEEAPAAMMKKKKKNGARPGPQPTPSPTPDPGTFRLEAKVSGRRVILSWPEQGSGLKYEVNVALVRGASFRSLDRDLAGTSWSGEVGLTGTTYYFCVEAFHPNGEPGPLSKVKAVLVP